MSESPPFYLPSEPKRKKRAVFPLPENAVQRAVFRHIKARGVPGLFAFHPKNGGSHQRGKRAPINSGLGVVSGVPDIILIHAGKTYAIELKTERGKLSDGQNAVLGRLLAAGADVSVARGLDEAIAVLERWGLLKGRPV